MDMELRHHVAERGDVELVARRHRLQGTGRSRNLGGELDLVGFRQVDDLARARAARHQQQPGIIGVVGEKQPRQRQVADGAGVAFELRMQ
jgi:hypothetical protein